MAGYANGTPSWVDLGRPDLDASAAFYGDLFGWTTTEPGPVEETGGYRMFLKNGKNVAGLGPAQEGQPIVWTTYLAADDADKTAELVKSNGGMVFLEPFDVLDAGRMAIFADPTGAAFGVWQAGQHTGAELVNEPGTITWNELCTRDVAAAKRFYSEAFGIDVTDHQMGGGPPYTVFNVNGRGVAGVLDMGDQFPAEVPANWVVYFGAESCDATVDKATSLGGSVARPAFDVETVGRMAWLSGPHGEVFAVFQNA